MAGEINRQNWFERLLDAESVNYAGSIVTIASGVTSALLTVYLGYQLAVGPSTSEQLILIPSLQSLILLITLILVSTSYRRKLIRIGQKDVEIAALRTEAADGLKRNLEISKNRMLIARTHYKFCQELQVAEARGNFVGLDSKFERYLDEVLAHTAELFGSYTGDKCSACIKILTQGSDGILASTIDVDGVPAEFVRTLRRDPTSRELRTHVDTDRDCSVYRYHANTAFFRIVGLGFDHYIENDLASLGNDYWNANKVWKNLYNATAVVPIKRPESRAQNQCAALLCLDNKRGRFDDARCLYMLDGIAIELHYGLRTFLVQTEQLQNGATP